MFVFLFLSPSLLIFLASWFIRTRFSGDLWARCRCLVQRFPLPAQSNWSVSCVTSLASSSRGMIFVVGTAVYPRLMTSLEHFGVMAPCLHCNTRAKIQTNFLFGVYFSAFFSLVCRHLDFMILLHVIYYSFFLLTSPYWAHSVAHMFFFFQWLSHSPASVGFSVVRSAFYSSVVHCARVHSCFKRHVLCT